MIRCPIPGCAGPFVNIACIKPAMTAHCNAFRRDPQVIFTFRAELARSWDVFTYPLRRYDPPTTAQPAPAGAQTNAQTDATPSSSPQPSQIRTTPLDSDRRVGETALRLSLQSGIKPASAAEALDDYDETDDASRGTGVFAFPKTPAGNMNWKSSLEIGTRGMGRETWTRDLGASTRRFPYTRSAGGSEDGYEQNESRTLTSLQEALYASATPPAEPPSCQWQHTLSLRPLRPPSWLYQFNPRLITSKYPAGKSRARIPTQRDKPAPATCPQKTGNYCLTKDT